MLRAALNVFIFLLPFVSAFAFTPTLTLSVLWSVAMLILLVVYLGAGKKIANPLQPENLLLAGCYCGILAGYLINGALETKPTNHLIAYTVTIFLFFVLINQYMATLGNSWSNTLKIGRALTYSMLFVGLFVFLEFTLSVGAGIDVNDFIPRPARAGYTNAVLDALFKRVRGFANESGQHAMMMETFLPICSYFLVKHSGLPKLLAWGGVLLLFLSLFFTFSAGAFIFLPSALVITLLYVFVFRGVKPVYVVSALVGFTLLNVVFYFALGYGVLELGYTIVEGKLSGSGSLNDRTSRFSAFADFYSQADTFHRFVGFGPSGFRLVGLEDSILSLYPTILFEGGMIGFLCFMSFLAYIFYLIVQIQDGMKPYLMVGFLSCCFHYAIVGGYWRPWLWFLAAFICLVYRSERYQTKTLT